MLRSASRGCCINGLQSAIEMVRDFLRNGLRCSATQDSEVWRGLAGIPTNRRGGWLRWRSGLGSQLGQLELKKGAQTEVYATKVCGVERHTE